jgi:predicted molibdopterin-dependent oxidoreductase YjgC
MSINVFLDGKKIEAQAGQTILQVAKENNIRIPTLCYHKDLSPTGNCRMCVVEIKGNRLLQAACVTTIAKDMVIQTNSDKVRRDRKLTLELMLANHTANCSYCEVSNDCELQDLVYEYEVDAPAWGIKGTRYQVDSDPNPYSRVDFNKCILCRRCVLACSEIQCRDVLGVAYRGFHEQIIAGAGTTLLEARCESCGQCVAYCPTGALSNKINYGQGIAKAHQIKKVTTTCSYCGVGCQFDLIVKHQKVVGVASNPNAPVNGMALCIKGRYGYDYIHHPNRLKKPRVRRYLLENKEKRLKGNAWDWIETDWSTALDITARKLREARDIYGPNSVGLLTSVKGLNEENYLMNKLARQVIGTNNIDNYASLWLTNTVTGLDASLGSGAMSNSIDDVAKEAKAFFVIGSNTTEQHPVFGAMIRRAVRFRGAKLVVADPQCIDLIEFATLHLCHNPGTDTALLNGLMYIILDKGWENKTFIEDHTEGFDDFKVKVMQYPPTRVSEITGIPVSQLYEAAEIIAQNKPTAVIWARGIVQGISGAQNVMGLADLQMLLSNIGVPGGGLNPLCGQNNSQGTCDLGGMPNLYPAYQPVTSEEVRAKFESAWGATSNTDIGATFTEMLSGILEGKLRALYLFGEDPVMSDPVTHHIRECLEKVGFLVLQEIFPSETSAYADVLLPGVSFAEKTGTFTNTERRVQMVRQAIKPLGDARPDWWITSEIAKRILAGTRQRVPFEAPYSGWEYRDTSEIMSEINALAPLYGGITYERLEGGEQLQWPCPTIDHPGTPILHMKQFARGKGKFTPIDHVPPTEEPVTEYQMV